MNPYLNAFEAYHREPPGLPWSDMISAHFHTTHAWIISTPGCFVAARQVDPDWPDSRILDPSDVLPSGRAIHLYVAAGTLPEILSLIPADLCHTIDTITFQRRGYRVHRMPLDRLR